MENLFSNQPVRKGQDKNMTASFTTKPISSTAYRAQKDEQLLKSNLHSAHKLIGAGTLQWAVNYEKMEQNYCLESLFS